MSDDPYRDELASLRAENQRLRELLLRGHRRSKYRAVAAAVVGIGAIFALNVDRTLLNAPSDGRFWLGAAVALAIVLGAGAAIARLSHDDAAERGVRGDT